MKPYATPKERKVGENRPLISHTPPGTAYSTKADRQKEKQVVAVQRRAIKKSARRQLQQSLREELDSL